jgi:hypothetical protein
MPDAPRAQPAVRLVFQYDGDRVQLLSQIPVTMVVPNGDPEQAAPGVYVDSRSVDDRPLARVRAHGAMAPSAEVFPAQPTECLYHVERPRRGAFSVVVPASPEAHHVAVVKVARRTEAPDGGPATATDLAQFLLQRG